jgi:hypothetical protein
MCVRILLLHVAPHIAHQRVFTDANVRDPEIAIKIGKAMEKAYEEARHADISLSPSVELALELMGDDSWGYYFADHDRRVIFWFEDHHSLYLLNSVRGVERKSHVSESSTRSNSFWGFSHCVRRLPLSVCTTITILVCTASRSLLFPP